MSRKSKNTFEVVGKDISIRRDDWDFIAYTTFREDYYQELISATWTYKEGYLFNTKLGYLHRYVMKKWYGEDAFQDFDGRGYVVDHLVNEGTDCRLSNLEFLKKSLNTAKGLIFDQESEKMVPSIAVRLFKDFNTGCYQITIGCNEKIYGIDDEDGNLYLIDTVKLLYNCDYSRVFLDAESIILQFDTDRKINLDKLSNVDRKIEIAKVAIIPEEMKNTANIQINGDYWQVTEDKRTITISSHFDEGWIPPRTLLFDGLKA